MTSVQAELNLINKYFTLSKDRATQPVVARRNTIPTLMKFAQHQDSTISRIAALTIELLTSHPDNPEFMCREKGFLPLMYNMFKDTEINNPELHDTYAKIFDNLRPALSGATSNKENEENLPPGASAKKQMPNRGDGESARISKYRSSRVLVSAAASARRNIKIEIQGADSTSPSTKSDLEELFQTIRGVISYSIDADAQSATLLLTTPTPTLMKVLQDAGFQCKILEEHKVACADADENADETGGFFGRGAGANTGNKFLNRGYFNADTDFRKSLVPHGLDGNSLTDRLKKQKEDQLRKKKAAESGSIKTFISGLTTGWW